MKLLTAKEASKILSVTEQTARNLITRGELKSKCRESCQDN